MAKNNEKGIVEANEVINASEAFFQKHGKKVFIALAAVILLIVGVFAFHNYVSVPKANKASTALAVGQELFGQDQFDVALNGDSATYDGFLKIASDYSGTDAGNLANLYAGLCYANLDQWENAVKYFEKYNVADDQMVGPATQAALGNAYAHVEQYDKAVSALKKAAKMADKASANGVNYSISATFLMQAAKILENQDKKAEALSLYKEVKEKYVNSAVVQSGEVDKYIERASR